MGGGDKENQNNSPGTPEPPLQDIVRLNFHQVSSKSTLIVSRCGPHTTLGWGIDLSSPEKLESPPYHFA